MISKTFFEQLELMAKEKEMSYEEILEATKKSLANAYKKSEGLNSNVPIRIELKPEKHEIQIYAQYMVVEEVKDIVDGEPCQVTLADAKKLKSNVKVGDTFEVAVDPKKFGRIAASTGKQVFNQTVRGFEKDKTYRYFKDKENEMLTADVVEISDDYITLNIGYNTTTLLPKKETLPNDKFEKGDRINVYLVSVEVGNKGPKIYVSRSDKNLVTRLMENNIPEIASGVIEIKGIARDPGDRTKVAVYSQNANVDAIGSCVGEKGSRIKKIVEALNNEKIDLYLYSEDPAVLIANSLQPAKVISVIDIDPKNKTSLAIVPDNQLSLAIGKAGQNVRLAVQSCGYKIDIKSQSEADKENISY